MSLYHRKSSTSAGGSTAIGLGASGSTEHAVVYFLNDGKAHIADWTGSFSYDLVEFDSYNADTWYRVHVDLDLSTKKYRVRLDDNNWSDWVNYNPDYNYLDTIGISGDGNGGACDYWWDYIQKESLNSFYISEDVNITSVYNINVFDNQPTVEDVTITNAGVTAISAGVIVDADVSASAAIDYSKLAALTDGNILVGSAGNVATSVNPTGDIDVSQDHSDR